MYKYDYISTGGGGGETSDDVTPTEEEEEERPHPQRSGRSLQEELQYGLSLTQVPEVWLRTSRYPERYVNVPVKVCVIDTGYDSLHEDLPKMMAAENDGEGGGATATVAMTGTQTGYGDPMTDGDGHGTHVSILYCLLFCLYIRSSLILVTSSGGGGDRRAGQ